MYRIGLSTCGGKPLHEETFRAYRDTGISAMEISIPPEKYPTLDFMKLRELSVRYGVQLWSLHLPYYPFRQVDISSCDNEIRRNTIYSHKELMGRSRDAGLDKFVIHASGEPIGEQRDERMRWAMDSLYDLAEAADRYGAVLAVENLPRTCLGQNSDEILRLIRVNDKLRVCFDTNHLLREHPVDFLHRVGEKIITTHISDCDLLDECHWLPGEGKLPWSVILKAFRDISYDGVWMYEVSFGQTKRMTRSRILTYADISANACTLFS